MFKIKIIFILKQLRLIIIFYFEDDIVFFVAVLEFELRKAQDTIKSLRASLTKEAGKNL